MGVGEGVIVWVCGCDCVGESGSVYLWQPSLTVCVGGLECVGVVWLWM